MANVNISESTISENSTTEVHNDEFSQTEEQSEVSAAEQPEYSAVSEVPEEYETAGAETAVSEVSEETGISDATESVVSDVLQKVDTAKNAQAFLLLAGVFGAVIAAMILKRKFQKDKRKKTADKSQLTAKERDEIRLAEKKRKKEKKKVVKKKHSVPRTTQKTLPYKCVCDNYLMKVDDNKYSKTYVFEDVNYSIAKQEEQESIFLGYCSVLNSFDTSADIQITVHNNRVNKDEFNRMVLLRYKGNDYDHYIDVYNEMLKDKMEKGQNGIIRKKYLTVTLQAPDLETARGKFTAIDLELTNAFKKIGSVIMPLTSNDRVNLLKDIFKSVDDKIPKLSEKDFKRQAERAYCCPDYFEFKKDYFMWNNKYARTMFIKDMPSSLKDDMLTEIANTNLDVMITVNIAPVDPYKALKIVNHQLTSMRANKLQAEKKALRSGYTTDVINEDLKHSLVEAEELLDDLRSKNQKMFLNNIIIMVTADDIDELDNSTAAIEAVIRKQLCSVSTLKFQQEKGLQSVLPLGNCTLKIRRTLTTESTAVFLPFAAKEISQKNGMYYGYMKQLAARSEAIHNGNVDPSEDNMLKITHEARLLGLDSRCIFKDAEPVPDSKVMKLLDNLEQNYRDTMEQKGVQIVFCDIAINEDAEHFSVYEAIKSNLIKRGISSDEICFAGNAKTDKARAEMFEQLRKGEKRFIIASTSKLGTGANIQDRICAIHHLDIPWRPADLIQQNGRGIRQGNMFDEVAIYHYLTEETFDAYMMGIITNKAKFINQIMTSKDPVRVSEDVDEMVLTYSQMQAIASGNPMIKEKIQLDNDIAMLKTLEAEHKKSVFKMQELAERKLPQTIDNYADLLQKASADLKAYQEQHPDNAEFKIEIGGKTVDERTDAGKEIEAAIIKCSTTGETVAIGKYFGFGVTIEKNPANTTLFSSGTPCVAVLHGKLNYTCEVSLGNDVGNVRRIENLAGNQINQKIQQLSANLDKAKNDLEEAKANMAKPFERAEELAQMQARLEFVNAELSKKQVDDEPIIVVDEPSEDSKDDDLDIADKINPRPKNISPQNDEPPHKFRH